ncbi:sensor histidine kinase [Arenibacter sp. TNZ]|jgi:LytS/YehU family sensor histidine kinase|uniref:sensor histidine kinase n=1 Tax=Arenibacter TaxID=178469 RepID=UPI000CD3E9BC|nr:MULTISPECIES: histidine kinase [Arenibacter]MCM4173425.1 sensor histidine kinase [Arenibacter sp. TNZ]
MQINKLNHKILGENNSGEFNINYKHHIIFWAVYILFNIFRWGNIHQDFVYAVKTNLLGFPIHMALAYFNIYFLMPKFVYTKRYFTYTVLLLATLFIGLIIKFNLTYYLVSNNVMPEAGDVESLTLNYAIVTMLGELYVMSFVTAIKITVDWLNENSKLHELEKRQLTTELKFLRSQVSPHFFFNTLNNIYSLTLEKSDRAPEIVLRLSELMRYLLYATDKPYQDLTKEIECIQNYVDLERIRFDNSLKIDLNIKGDIEEKKIAPMLLMPFIENCFKHGASKNIGNMYIKINLEVVDDILNFEVRNNVTSKKNNKLLKRDYGIGLSNVKKRLELGYEPKDYNLSIFEKDKMFNVILKLKV